MKYTLKYYETDTGDAPLIDWLETLKDRKTAAVIKARIERLRFGLFGDTKYLEQEVSELRIHFGPGYRVYYTQAGDKIIILLCAGDKSSQKKDIKKAIEYTKLLKENGNA
jgi:putative addiction module killer protein